MGRRNKMLYSELEKRIIEELKQGYSYEKVAEIVNTTTHIVQKTVDKLKEYRAQNVLNEILMNKALRNQKILEKDYLDFFEEEILDGKTSLELCYELEQQELQNGASVIFTEKRITDYLKELLYERTPYQYPEQYKELIAKLKENNQKNGYKKYCEFKNSGIDVTKYLLKQSIQAYENETKKRKLALDSKSIPIEKGITQLSMEYGLLNRTVNEILNCEDPQQLVVEYHGEVEAEKIKDTHQKRIENTRIKNSQFYYFQGERTKVSEEDQKKESILYSNQDMILNMILQYRLSCDSLQRIFNFDSPEYLQQIILKIASIQPRILDYDKSISYVLYNYNQERYPNKETRVEKETENYRKASEFYVSFLKAVKEDPKKAEEIRKSLFDMEYEKVVNNPERDFSKLSPKDQRTVIEYRLKYFLPFSRMPYDRHAMERRVPEDLKREWEIVNAHNLDISIRIRNERNAKKPRL